jgi:hypothetical protein
VFPLVGEEVKGFERPNREAPGRRTPWRHALAANAD